MIYKGNKKHMIDLIFPLVLLFVFAVSALVVTLFAANVYQQTVEDSSRSSTARTSLAYVTGKIHGGDTGGNIELTEFDGCRSIRITDTISGEKYETYIYFYKGEIKELFVKSPKGFTAESGTGILKVKDFSIEQKRDNLLLLTCTDDSNRTASSAVAIRSRAYPER